MISLADTRCIFPSPSTQNHGKSFITAVIYCWGGRNTLTALSCLLRRAMLSSQKPSIWALVQVPLCSACMVESSVDRREELPRLLGVTSAYIALTVRNSSAGKPCLLAKQTQQVAITGGVAKPVYLIHIVMEQCSIRIPEYSGNPTKARKWRMIGMKSATVSALFRLAVKGLKSQRTCLFYRLHDKLCENVSFQSF